MRRTAILLAIGIAIALFLLTVVPTARHENYESRHIPTAIAPVPVLTMASFTSPPSPAQMSTLTADDIQVIEPTGSPMHVTCAVYAGPLRWRRHPFGRGAPTQSLRALPLYVPHRLAAPRRELVPFAPAALRLHADGGPFAQAAATNAEFLRALDQDRLFWSFRQTASLPQPRHARPFGGWERPGAGIRGHFVGHYLSALATGGAGGDASLVALAQGALSVLTECQRVHTSHESTRGYLAAFPPTEFDKVEGLSHGPRGDAWVPHYATQKVLTGLYALHVELGLAAALPLFLGMAEWLWLRSAAVHRAKGESHWAELLNYEVAPPPWTPPSDPPS